jgi:1-phosphofructokinase family hexose kinase
MIVTVTPNPSLDRTLEVRGFAAGGTYKSKLLASRPAGKGLNVSRCLAALGEKSCAVAIVGRSSARRFASSLDEQGIAHAFAESAGEVRQSTTVVDPGGGRETHLRERGGPVSPAEVDALVEAVVNAIDERAAHGDRVAVCGSLPEGFDAWDLARVIDAARSRGARVALDSSGEGLAAARLAGVDLVKPNAVELAELAGRRVTGPAEALAAARAASAELGATLLVTLGEDGALLVNGDVALRAKCEAEKSVSSVGAGDAALAGYLFAASKGRSPEDRLRYAVAAGAASLAETVAGMLCAARFERLVERVEVTEATPSA